MDRINAWYKSKLVVTGTLLVLKLLLLRTFLFGNIAWGGLPGNCCPYWGCYAL